MDQETLDFGREKVRNTSRTVIGNRGGERGVFLLYLIDNIMNLYKFSIIIV